MKNLKIKTERMLGEWGLGVSLMKSPPIGTINGAWYAYWFRIHFGPWTVIFHYKNHKEAK